MLASVGAHLRKGHDHEDDHFGGSVVGVVGVRVFLCMGLSACYTDYPECYWRQDDRSPG